MKLYAVFFLTYLKPLIVSTIRSYYRRYTDMEFVVFPSNGSKAILKTNPLSIQCGVPQGSTLSPLLFLISINDIRNCLVKANIRTLADDTTLFYSSNSLQELEKTINEEFNHLLSYCTANKLSVNFNKTYFNYDNLLPSKNEQA